MSDTLVIIDAKEASFWRRLLSLWQSRELIRYFIVRDLVGRYRPTALGLFWIFIRPAAELLTYTIVFGFILKVGSNEMPYPLFLAAGLVPWLFVSQTVTGSAGALASARHIMSKVHFPRLVVPLSHLGTSLVDFLVLFGVVLVLTVVLGRNIGWPILALPLFILAFVCLAFGVALLVASASVSSPDVTIGLPVVMRVMMYLSPIVYPRTFIPENWRWLYDLNPISPFVSGVRWCLGSTQAPEPVSLAIAVCTTAVVLVLGIRAFLRTERQMVDFL